MSSLFGLGLSPREFMALEFLIKERGRVTGAEVGQAMGMSASAGRRTLAELEKRGLIRRISRGRFDYSALTAERSPVSAERSPARVSHLVDITTSSSVDVLLEVPKGTSSRGAEGAPGSYLEMRFPMVAPGRISDEDPRGYSDDLTEEPLRKKLRRTAPARFHREDDPIETWTVAHVVKEFQIRIYQALPNYLYPVDGRKLSKVLGRLRREKGLSVPEMLEAMDTFFATEVHRVPTDQSPMGFFLAHLSRHRAEMSATQTEDPIDADFIAQFNRDW